MPDVLRHLLAPRGPGQWLTDIVDLVIVAYVIYRALLVLRGTRAMQMGTGLGLIFLVYIAAKWLSLVTLLNLLSTLLSSIILIVVVVFQNDIRRGLMRVGSRALLSGFARAQESKVIDEVVSAATELARHRMGALVAFEQDANLDEFVVGQGVPIDAGVTSELLVSLFVPESVNKLHDGAVIIRNLRVAKAGVFFPMPESRIVDTSLGSRHRAALGITEETDAVVVVVSEERGTISFCFSGNIVSNLDGASLRQALLGLFGQRPRKKGKKAAAATGRTSVTGPAPRNTGTPLPHPATAIATPTSTRASVPLPDAKPASERRPDSNPPPKSTETMPETRIPSKRSGGYEAVSLPAEEPAPGSTGEGRKSPASSSSGHGPSGKADR